MSGVGTVTAGSCNAIAIKSQDSYGNLSNVGSDATVTLSGAGSAGAFYTTAGCSTSMTATTIVHNSNTKTVYFQATVAGNLSLSAAASGLANGALSVTVQPNVVSQIALSGTSSITAGVCSPFTMTAEDAYGNSNTVGSAVLVMLSGGGSGSFYSESSCTTSATNFTIASSASAQSFYFKDNKLESPTFASSNNGNLTSGSLAVTVSGASVTQLAISGSRLPQPVPAPLTP